MVCLMYPWYCKKMKKSYIFTFVILVVAFAFFMYNRNRATVFTSANVVSSTSPTVTKIIPTATVSTEGWKTCRNEAEEYEFKYPGEWYLFTMQENEINPPRGGTKSNDCEAGWISVSSLDYSDGSYATTSQYFTVYIVPDERRPAIMKGKTTIDSLVPSDVKILREYLVDGERALVKNSSPQYSSSLSFMHKGALFDVNTHTDDPLFETILSTFRFLK